MKKIFITGLLFTLFFVACKKEMYETKISNEVKNKIENKSFTNNILTKLDYFKLLAQEFLVSAKNSQEFKNGYMSLVMPRTQVIITSLYMTY
jgi:hypothetical protein